MGYGCGEGFAEITSEGMEEALCAIAARLVEEGARLPFDGEVTSERMDEALAGIADGM